jgi:phosphomevalonate kinase
MKNNQWSAFAPGKVYFGGEYAVVSGQSSAIIFNTTVGVHTTFTEGDAWSVTSSQQVSGYELTHHLGLVAIPSNLLVQDSINIIQRYAQQLEFECLKGHLHIESSLDYSATTKYGLGSSGAVCVSIIKVLSQAYGLELSPLEIYKLAVLAQLEHFSYSSHGDVAVSAYNTWIIYKKYDDTWLYQHIHKDIEWLLHHVWPNLRIDVIKAHHFPISLVFTGTPADSQELVRQMKPHLTKPYYSLFIESTKQSIEPLSHAIDQDCMNNILKHTKSLTRAMDMLQRNTKIEIKTPVMERISQIIEPFEGLLKVSGAGGGDCVWCLYPDVLAQQMGNDLLIQEGFVILDDLVHMPNKEKV